MQTRTKKYQNFCTAFLLMLGVSACGAYNRDWPSLSQGFEGRDMHPETVDAVSSETEGPSPDGTVTAAQQASFENLRAAVEDAQAAYREAFAVMLNAEGENDGENPWLTAQLALSRVSSAVAALQRFGEALSSGNSLGEHIVKTVHDLELWMEAERQALNSLR